jgi:hypothetical protein
VIELYPVAGKRATAAAQAAGLTATSIPRRAASLIKKARVSKKK